MPICTYLVSQNTATENLSDPSASCVSIKSLTFSRIIDDFYGANTSGCGSSRVPWVPRPCRHNSNPRDQSEALVWAFLLATGDYGRSHTSPLPSHNLSPIHFVLDAISHPSPLQSHKDNAKKIGPKNDCYFMTAQFLKYAYSRTLVL